MIGLIKASVMIGFNFQENQWKPKEGKGKARLLLDLFYFYEEKRAIIYHKGFVSSSTAKVITEQNVEVVFEGLQPK